MLQFGRGVPVFGIQSVPHLVSCSESSIIQLSSVINRRIKKIKLDGDIFQWFGLVWFGFIDILRQPRALIRCPK